MNTSIKLSPGLAYTLWFNKKYEQAGIFKVSSFTPNKQQTAYIPHEKQHIPTAQEPQIMNTSIVRQRDKLMINNHMHKIEQSI